MIRVVIDTNLWISTLISRRLVRLETLLKSDRITLLFSAELMGEFLDTVQHPKFRKYFAAEDVQSLLQNIEPYREEIAVVSQVTICRDPKKTSCSRSPKTAQPISWSPAMKIYWF